MEITFKNYKYNKEILNTTIYPSTIVGITGKKYKEFLNIFNIVNKHTEIKINGNRLLSKDVDYFKNKIVYTKNINYLNKNITIKEYMINIITSNKLIIKNEIKKIINSLIVVGLEYLDINTNINDLTTSEKTLLTISIDLLYNPEIIIIDEPYLGLDKTNTKILNIIFNKLKDEYSKTIIIGSNDSNELYKYTDYMYFINNSKIQIEGSTEELYQDIELLKKYKYQIPDSIKFISKVQEKGIKLEYKKDIRDIIKDIYKLT